MRKLLIAIMAALMLALPLSASISSNPAFLRVRGLEMPVSARMAGMGMAGISSVKGYDALNYNPAALADSGFTLTLPYVNVTLYNTASMLTSGIIDAALALPGATEENQQELRKLLAGISILAVLLAAAILSLVRVMKKVSVAERRTREKNDELQTLNGRLHEYIMMLQEANDIKESYLVRYLDMCSDYIEGLERYRSHLRKSAKNGGFAEVMDNLKSRDFIEKELQEFYAQFDATFLDLFPDFIAQLNGLLQPDKRIEDTSKEGILSTELRVMALIRLGVNDSVKIAHFLRRSVSTIYNYRVKLRNAAMSDREEFERQIMHIGRFGQNAVHVKE